MQESFVDTIKRMYDQYNLQDFNFGEAGSDNLNPQREMVKDKITIIEAAVQEITDDIVRKKIRQAKKDAPKVRTPIGGESLPGVSLEKFEKAKRAGSTDNDIFSGNGIPTELESIVGSFPGNPNELSKPPVIDCEEVFKKYTFSGSHDEGSQTTTTSTTASAATSISLENDLTNSDIKEISIENDDSEDDNIDCAAVEMEWLKMILSILNIIKMMTMITEKILSCIMLLSKIVALAAGAWVCPPNIAELTQTLISSIMGILSSIITKLIEALFSMLNLDCLSEQTLEFLEQIQEAKNAFSNIMGLLDPNTLKLYGNQLEGEVQNIKDIVKELYDSKKDAFAKAIEDIKESFTLEKLSELKDQIVDETINTAINASTNAVMDNLQTATNGRAQAIINQSTGLVMDAIKMSKDIKKKYDEATAKFSKDRSLLEATMTTNDDQVAVVGNSDPAMALDSSDNTEINNEGAGIE